MRRFRLRYQAIDFNLGADEFVAGRTADCDLVLDDGLVSRRHASFQVKGETVELKDLGSRNGVSVNGVPIRGAVMLQRGDKIRIGAQELVLVDATPTQVEAGTAELVRCKSCGALQELGKACSSCGQATGNMNVVNRSSRTSMTKDGMQLSASLGATMLADKAFSLGRFDEAERLLSARLSALLARAAQLEAEERDMLKVAVGYAVRLAEGLQKPSWLDYPFDLYANAGLLMPADTIEELYRAATRVRYVNPHAVRRYLTGLRSRTESWAANERFLLQRLEGLERRIVSG